MCTVQFVIGSFGGRRGRKHRPISGHAAATWWHLEVPAHDPESYHPLVWLSSCCVVPVRHDLQQDNSSTYNDGQITASINSNSDNSNDNCDLEAGPSALQSRSSLYPQLHARA